MSERSHKTLERQLKRFKLSKMAPPDLETWNVFLESVASVYQQAQDDKDLLERSLDLASKEMRDQLLKDKDLSIQLAQANKMASLGTLASGVAHELNNPLAGIRGYAEILLESPHLTPDCKTKLDRIFSLSERAASIVTHLLKLSRKIDLQALERVDLSGAVSEITEFYRTKLSLENVKLETKIPEGIYVNIDFQRFTSVVQNVLNNSLDEFARREFAADKQKKITIDTFSTNLEDSIPLRLIDNAGGIQPEVIDKIFDPFFTTKEVGKGTGLGLSLSRQIAQDLGGNLTCTSLGDETTFIFTVKLFRENHHAISNVLQGAPQSSFERTPGAKFRLLLVDDEQDILNVLEHRLGKFFNVTCLQDSAQAVEYLRTMPCDILLTDLKMPKLAGDQLMVVAREVKPGIGLVLMSGHLMVSDEVLKINADEFVRITKPTPNTETLVQLIQSSLEKVNKKAC